MILIIVNTVREFWRNKLLKLIFFCSILFVLLSLIIWQLTISESNKIVWDFWFFFIEVFGLIITLSFGSNLIHNEQKRKTLHLILIKNNSWANFILWKYFWFTLILLIYISIISFIFFIIQYFYGDLNILLWITIILSMYIKLLVLLSIILFFCSFVSPMIAMITSGIIYLLGHSLSFVKYYISNHPNVSFGFTKYITDIAYYILPDFWPIDFKEYLTNPFFVEKIHTGYIFANVWIQILYICVILFFTVVLFNLSFKNKHDFGK